MMTISVASLAERVAQGLIKIEDANLWANDPKTLSKLINGYN